MIFTPLALKSITFKDTTYQLSPNTDHTCLFFYGKQVVLLEGKLYLYPGVWNPRNNNHYFPGSIVRVENVDYTNLGVLCSLITAKGGTAQKWKVRLVLIRKYGAKHQFLEFRVYTGPKSSGVNDEYTKEKCVYLVLTHVMEKYGKHINLDTCDADTWSVIQKLKLSTSKNEKSPTKGTSIDYCF